MGTHKPIMIPSHITIAASLTTKNVSMTKPSQILARS